MNDPQPPELNPYLKKVDKPVLLSQCGLFSGLNRWELFMLSQMARLVEFKKDEIVYAEKEQVSNFYVIVSGRFEAFHWSEGQKKVLAYFQRGDHFGEIALLTGEPHSATVQALSDSLVFEFKKEDFRRILEHKAKVSLELSRRLSSRLKASDPRSESLSKSEVISVVSRSDKCGRISFASNLAASISQEARQPCVLLDIRHASDISLKPTTRTILLDRFLHHDLNLNDYTGGPPGPDELGYEYLRVICSEKGAEGGDRLVHLINRMAVQFRYILVQLPPEIDDLVLKALSHSDFIFFTTENDLEKMTHLEDTLGELERSRVFFQDQAAVVVEEELLGIQTTRFVHHGLFVGKRWFTLPTHTLLHESDEFGLKPISLEKPKEEFSRAVRHIARYVSHNLVGLALGSGAALGLAHIGVLKVLEREEIPVDIIAGSSIGSLIGGLFAMGMTAAEIEIEMIKVLTNKWKLCDLLDLSLLPVRGLLHGANVNRLFKKHFGDTTFEDCRTKLRIVAANLTTWQTVTYDSGPLIPAIRASIAIPAIFKPILRQNEVIVDGGIFSPVPIRTLKQAGASKIIAVNVFPNAADLRERKAYQEALKEKEIMKVRQKDLMGRLLSFISKQLKACVSPNIFDILMNTMQSMESEIAEIETAEADVLIRPVIPTAQWVDFNRPKPFIEKGEAEALKALPKIRELVSPGQG